MHLTQNRRGVLLVSSYLLLSIFLLYSSSMTLHTTTQHMVADRLKGQLQARNLAQGAIEETREDFYNFFKEKVYQGVEIQGDALKAFEWLDQVKPESVPENPALDLDALTVPTAEGAGLSESDPRIITLPGITCEIPPCAKAWIVKAIPDPTDPTVPPARLVTIEAVGQSGSITKRIQATYRMALGVSDIFKYAYFLNNYGWLSASGSLLMVINGEVRANGDLDMFSDTVVNGEFSKIYVHGDLYASKNLAVINPVTGLPSEGIITGNPTQLVDVGPISAWQWYAASSKTFFQNRARPPRRLTEPTQPAIGGTPTILSTGHGWASEPVAENPDAPEQARYEKQQPQDMPYLGDLAFYRTLAKAYNANNGSTLTYYDAITNSPKTISAEYAGPNGTVGDADDKTPLLLIGTSDKPIQIDGPVVIPGDVIIRGVVSGRGTIYAGRNVHIVGNIQYQTPTLWPTVERDTLTGRLRETGVTSGSASNLGTVCTNGSYYGPTESAPGGCI